RKMVEKFFGKLSHEDQLRLMDQIEETGIRIEDPPFWDNVTFDDFKYIYKKWKIEKYHLYTYRYGRKVNILNTHVVGNLYLLKLKHTGESKFSARSTAHINVMDLPDKSSATKNNKSLYPKTPVKIGEMELQNLMISNDMSFVKTLVMTLATSLQARRNIKDLYVNDVFDYDSIKVDEECTNRNVETFDIKLNAMGYDLVFEDEDGNVVDV
ncbi:hypothetical protein V6O07_10810, partial [Arthrospira platensis SPKY2]